MRSNVQKLFHALKSTAVGIQPINATTKASPAGVVQSHSASGAVVAGGGDATVSATAVTVDTNSTPARSLMTLSRALNFPTQRSAVHPTNRATVTDDVSGVSVRADTPSRLSRKAPVTMPTAAITKKHVPSVRARYIHEAPFPRRRNPSIRDSPEAEA